MSAAVSAKPAASAIPICPLCHDPVTDPVTDECGHTFDAKCLKVYSAQFGKEGASLCCPTSGRPINPKPDLKAKQAIVLHNHAAGSPAAVGGPGGPNAQMAEMSMLFQLQIDQMTAVLKRFQEVSMANRKENEVMRTWILGLGDQVSLLRNRIDDHERKLRAMTICDYGRLLTNQILGTTEGFSL